MTSQKFQLTAEYKRKEKRFFIFLAFFFPIFTIITGCYSEGEKLTWKFFWIGAATILVLFTIIISIVYFAVLRKVWKYWVELEFRNDSFIISQMGKDKEFLYSKIKKVVSYTSPNGKLFYTKLVFPHSTQYIMYFEKERELIEILEQKIIEYTIQKVENVRYINISTYRFKIITIIIAEIVVAVLLHYFS